MTSAIVFSRDRAPQLDLLLQSIKRNAPSVFDRTTVLFTHSARNFRDGYQKCMDEHEDVLFVKERDFREQVRDQVARADKYVSFLCDDDIFYRWHVEPRLPSEILATNPTVLCVSLRLGRNTNWCYPMDQPQGVAKTTHCDGMEVYKWKGQAYDWGYVGSLDGDMFRREQLRFLISEGDWKNPNELEEHLHLSCRRTTTTPFVACYKQSLLLGNPVNRVTLTHGSNRVGQDREMRPYSLNHEFLAGRRFLVQNLVFPKVRAAHVEVALVAKEVVK